MLTTVLYCALAVRWPLDSVILLLEVGLVKFSGPLNFRIFGSDADRRLNGGY